MNKLLAVALACVLSAICLIVMVLAQVNSSPDALALNESPTPESNHSVNLSVATEISNDSVSDSESDNASRPEQDLQIKLHLDHRDILPRDEVIVSAFVTENGQPIETQADFSVNNEVSNLATDSNGFAALAFIANGAGSIEVKIGNVQEKLDYSIISENSFDKITPDIRLPYIMCDYYPTEVLETYPAEFYKVVCRRNDTLAKTTCNEMVFNIEKTRKKEHQVCQKNSRRLVYKNSTLKFLELHNNCSVVGTELVCDETCYELNGRRECGDGDGDGKCEPGETCIRYALIDGEIRPPIKANGKFGVAK